MGLITQLFLPLSLAFIMFAMGLTLVPDNFRRVALQPKAFAVGAASQVLVLPLVAFVLVLLWPVEPALAVGVMILAACPGGVTSNLLTHLVRGDTALSISLTAVISLLSVVTIPLIVNFALYWFTDDAGVELPVARSIIGIFLITTVPVVLGMLVRAWRSEWTQRVEPRFRQAATVLFLVIVLGAILSQLENLVQYAAVVAPLMLVLNLLMMAVGWYAAKLFRLGEYQGKAISLECGLQNGTMAIFVAATLLENETMMMPGAIYGLLMFVTSGAWVGWMARRAPQPA
ncbi:MAG: bile acid:sodium symporter family protein [Xanthomonadaceae bacterium]|nr:bile acid:sodium symporter family protein [Xanthomonadaceae bacterium]